MNRLFSVVIPLYNKEKFIYNTVESVLIQSYINFELIIINDGSTDNGINIVNGIDDDRIIIFHQENSGVSVARNKGIEVAHGTHIAFLDADDLWEVDYLSSINSLINDYSEASIFATSYQIQITQDKCREAVFSNACTIKSSLVIEDYFSLSLKDPLVTS